MEYLYGIGFCFILILILGIIDSLNDKDDKTL